MQRLLLAIGAAVAVAIGFFGALALMERGGSDRADMAKDAPPPPPTKAALARADLLRDNVVRLMACARADKSRASCTNDAQSVLEAIDERSTNAYHFYRDAAFKVIVVKDMIVMYRRNCTPKDVEVDEFHWNAWPRNADDLPAHRRTAGFEGSVAKFSEHGIKVRDACIVAVKLSFERPLAIEVGQLNRADGRWPWRVTNKT